MKKNIFIPIIVLVITMIALSLTVSNFGIYIHDLIKGGVFNCSLHMKIKIIIPIIRSYAPTFLIGVGIALFCLYFITNDKPKVARIEKEPKLPKELKEPKQPKENV